MACDLTLGRLEPCKDTVGGYKNLYFINYDGGLSTNAQYTAEEITSLTTPVASFKYELKGANSFDEVSNDNSRETGSTFWTGTGTFVFKKQSLTTQKELKLLAYGRPQMILEGNDGLFRLVGLDNGCECTVGTSGGAGMGDLNGYNIVITSTEDDMATYVATDQIDNAAGFTVTVGT